MGPVGVCATASAQGRTGSSESPGSCSSSNAGIAQPERDARSPCNARAKAPDIRVPDVPWPSGPLRRHAVARERQPTRICLDQAANTRPVLAVLVAELLLEVGLLRNRAGMREETKQDDDRHPGGGIEKHRQPEEAGCSPRVDRVAAYPKRSSRQEMSGCLVGRRILVTAQHGDLRPAKQADADDQQRDPDHKGHGKREKPHRRNEIQDHDQSYSDDRSKLNAWRRDRIAGPVRHIGGHRRDHISSQRGWARTNNG